MTKSSFCALQRPSVVKHTVRFVSTMCDEGEGRECTAANEARAIQEMSVKGVLNNWAIALL